MSKSD